MKTAITCGKTDHSEQGFSVARDFAYAFYNSSRWQNTRKAYMRMGQGLCERCLAKGIYKPAEIVHHKVHLSPANIDDPSITLDYGNLERLCRDCHAEAHPEIYGSETECMMRVGFDKDGNVVRLETSDDR